MKAEKAEAAGVAIQPPRGTYDIVPGETRKWQALEALLCPVVSAAGYKEIRTPVFEHTELFKRGVGETTDIVNKEMYTFADKSERSLTLRPEGTAGVVRAYLSHGLSRQSPPVKLWYMGPMFRYERTQTGRQRQFHQIGIEAFGSEGPAIDAEVIVVAVDCMAAVGVKNFQVHLNSIGCRQCRPRFREILKEAIASKRQYLCQDCQDRFERNPLRMLDCKSPACQEHYQGAPASLDNLCPDCLSHWQGLLSLLAELGVAVVINERLVRGLDYYGRTVFELIADDTRLGVQSTICAGGRYDYLVETLGGPPTPAVGWAAGLERISLLMEPAQAETPLTFVVCPSAPAALKLACAVRRAGFSCELDFPPQGGSPRGFARQLQQANKTGAAWSLIQGEDELQGGEVTVKSMKDGSQARIPVEKLIAFLQENCRNGV